jgi:hypothetical protein
MDTPGFYPGIKTDILAHGGANMLFLPEKGSGAV